MVCVLIVKKSNVNSREFANIDPPPSDLLGPLNPVMSGRLAAPNLFMLGTLLTFQYFT